MITERLAGKAAQLAGIMGLGLNPVYSLLFLLMGLA